MPLSFRGRILSEPTTRPPSRTLLRFGACLQRTGPPDFRLFVAVSAGFCYDCTLNFRWWPKLRKEQKNMNRKLFGTDGVRGLANTFPMTPEIAMKVGMAAGRIFTRGEHRHRVVIGKDTRLSGYMIESALVAG